ncbi:hypothetical protein UCREL1_5170 [Eutypa lata UCREL1]|uniref:Uncharacterized protein n=1 Tax=Eutypa lata (strain UCR-EL1) TaxID=1287681 RepID=M7SN35_EUTLA|nr:hypothetical protein UCREL1_5170 [Eutypa lata UCREL1]
MTAGDGISPPPKVQKTERSHEENQERAYIAASRRADRSLEARVQSAKMASDIHRRRTGRSLKVSEEIVLREEMYEEEEDDMPRQYKYLTAHLQTNSPEMNNRVNAYITTQAAMATMARGSRSPAQPPPISTTQGPGQTRHDSLDSIDRRLSVADSLTSNNSAISSPPALSPGSSTTPESRDTPYQTPVSAFPSSFQIDPQLTQQQQPLPPSIFTSELPNEAKLMANVDMSDPMAMSFFGGDPSTWSMFGQISGDKGFENPEKTGATPNATEIVPNDGDFPLFPPTEPTADRFDIPLESYSRVGTPGGGGGDAWESFVDFGSEL